MAGASCRVRMHGVGGCASVLHLLHVNGASLAVRGQTVVFAVYSQSQSMHQHRSSQHRPHRHAPTQRFAASPSHRPAASLAQSTEMPSFGGTPNDLARVLSRHIGELEWIQYPENLSAPLQKDLILAKKALWRDIVDLHFDLCFNQ
eukprot:5520737-Alexandrium_andersonii.AAC.1